MLDLNSIDLAIIAEALEDQSEELTWWLNTETGDLVPHDGFFGGDVEDEDPEEQGLLCVSSFDSRHGYRDMQDFVAACGAGALQDRLARAITGRGAFRRFRDTVYEDGEVAKRWNAFHDYRVTRRAIQWLESKDVITTSEADSALSALVEPSVDLPPEPGEDEQLRRLRRVEGCAQTVVDEAQAIGWLGSISTTSPDLEQAIRELAQTLQS